MVPLPDHGPVRDSVRDPDLVPGLDRSPCVYRSHSSDRAWVNVGHYYANFVFDNLAYHRFVASGAYRFGTDHRLTGDSCPTESDSDYSDDYGSVATNAMTHRPAT